MDLDMYKFMIFHCVVHACTFEYDVAYYLKTPLYFEIICMQPAHNFVQIWLSDVRIDNIIMK